MKNKIIFIFLSFFSLVCFAQNDSTEVKKRKNHFGISFQYGRVTPKLHTNYAYSKTSANVYGLGLTYERDLSKHCSFFSSFQFNLLTKTRISILEKRELYLDDYGLNYFIEPHIDVLMSFGMNYHLFFPKLKNEILSFGGSLGMGISNIDIFEQYNPGFFQPSPYPYGGGKIIYLLVSLKISKRFLIGKSHYLEPSITYNHMVIKNDNANIFINNSPYYTSQYTKLSYNYGLVGIQFTF